MKRRQGKPIQLELALIPHEVERTLINQRAKDGYVNATAMCQAVGKRFNNYSRMEATQEFIEELSAVTRIRATELIQVVTGGTPELQGTWVHPDVAINLGQWCSPKFAVAVAQWVREWATGKAKPALPYHLERYLANSEKVPPGHFSILNEMMIRVFGPLEKAGYILPKHMVPDISEGRMFCQWLRDVKWIEPDNFPTYPQEYPDGRIVDARAYPNYLLPAFIDHLMNIWIPTRLWDYFRERDPKALEFLPRLLPCK